MTTITNYFEQAQLSIAAYALGLSQGISGLPYTDRLEAAGMSKTQATNFANTYAVVDQFTDPITGFSATVFDKGGVKYFTIRGTEGFTFAAAPDWLTNVLDVSAEGIALRQGLALLNYLQRLYAAPNNAVVQYFYNPIDGTIGTTTGTANGLLSGSLAPLSVAGHSLGGHLAMMMSRLVPDLVSSVYTYNAPGFDTTIRTNLFPLTSEGFFSLLRNAPIGPITGAIGTAWNSSIMTHLDVEGDVVHNIGNTPGIQNIIFSESASQGAFDAHLKEPITDSLALYDLFAKIDPTLNTTDPAVGIGKITDILKASSAQAASSLERTVDALVNFVGLEFAPLAGNQIDNRDALYQRIFPLQTAITTLTANSTLVVDSLVNTSAADLTNIAQGSTAFAYRYALRELNPFAILGSNDLYDPHNQNSELNLYDPVNRTGTLTVEWITDRAAFMAWKNIANTNDTTALSSNQITEMWRFIDLPQKINLSVIPQGAGTPIEALTHRAAFGGDSADYVQGGKVSDRLYGGGSTDYLEGKGGNDFLDGGGGLDLYQYNGYAGVIGSDDGSDVIRDTDGKGVLRYVFHDNPAPQTSVIADASVKMSDTEWRSADGRFIYTKSGADLVITIDDGAGGSMTLKDWRDGDFGIRLWETMATPPTTRDIVGDLEPMDMDPAQDGVQLGFDDLGNVIVTGNAAPDRADTLLDSGGADHIVARGGDDFIPALNGGSDWIEAGSGRDWVVAWAASAADLTRVEGGPGDDVLTGGASVDYLYANAQIDLAQAISAGGTPGNGLHGDWLSGGWGDDILVGDLSNDGFSAGRGKDIIVAGGGDDNILGDADWVATTLDWYYVDDTTANTRLFYLFNGSENFDVGEADIIYGGAGNDYVWSHGGDDLVYGEQGRDSMAGGGGSDVLIGGADDDLLEGDDPRLAPAQHGDDYLDGGAGDDVLWGDGGNDVLIGGPGTDILVGGAGRDIYVFDKGDGTETVSDTPASASDPEASIVVTGDGISRSDIKFRTGSLLVDFGGGDGIHFEGFDQLNPANTPLIGEIRFADGTSMSYADILAQGFDIDGTAGNDNGQTDEPPMLVGTGVTDRIRGFDGNDVLFGLAGDDVLDGGDGADQLIGGPGVDTIHGGAGDDQIWADGESGGVVAPDGSDVVYGGAGNDIVQGYDGDDQIFGDDDNDTLYGDFGGDIVEGGAGDDGLYGQGYYFSEGIPYLNFFDDGASDTLRGGDGNDYLNSAAGDDVLEGGSGDDTLEGEAGADSMAGGDGLDELQGGADDDTLDGGANNDVLFGEAGNDVLSGGEGDDQIVGSDGADTLDGGAGNDNLFGQAGNDVYVFGRGYGSDIISDEDATPGNLDIVQLAADISPDEVSVTVSPFIDSLELGIDGTTDRLTLGNQLSANIPLRIEEIRFADGTVWTPTTIPMLISGTAGDDVLNGTTGPDVFEGLAGNDTISGGTGSDSYRFGRGGGQDVITDSDSTIGNADKILFAADIRPADVRATRTGNDLVLTVSGTSDQVTVTNYFQNDGATPFSVEQIKFMADGTIWDVSTVKNLLLTATNGNDTIIGYATNDTLAGLAGNDTLTGNAGDDTLDGGTGNDVLQGGTGNDTYLVARGNGQDTITDVDATVGNVDKIVYAADILFSEVKVTRSGNNLVLGFSDTTDQVTVTDFFENDGVTASLVETIQFLAGDTNWDLNTVKSMVVMPTNGDDTIIGYATDDNLSGLGGNDMIRSASGNDTLDGGTENDSLSGEAGSDTYLFARGDGQDVIDNAASDTAGTTDVLSFAAGILPGEVTPARSASDLVLTVSAGGGEVRIQNYFLSGQNVVEEIRFADGTVWTEQTILTFLPPPPVIRTGTEANDTIVGDSRNELLRGLGGNDTIYGSGGNDTFEGGAGEDWLYGAGGNDTYLFNLGDGGPAGFFQGGDVISDAGGYDVLRFGAGISPAGGPSVTEFNDPGGYGHYINLDAPNTPGGVFILRYFDTGNIEEIRFEDGTVWTDQTIAPFVPIIGTGGNDSMVGNRIADVMYGFGGNDTIRGGQGHDTLDGGLGSDTLYGEDGNDTLIAGAGESKNAAVSNFLYGGAGDDVLISSGKTDFLYGELGNDILLGGAGRDGMEDTGGNNLFFGAANVDNIGLGDQNDIVMAGAGNDSLDGDRDADGTRGGDILVFNKSDGADSVSRLGSGSTISIGGGTLYGNFSLEVQGATLRLKTGSSHYIALTDWYASPANKSVATLQIVIEGTRDYKPTSANLMNNKKIQAFNFLGLVSAFDAARAAGQTFNVANNLATYRIGGSDTDAIGGAIAYQYARTGNLGTLTYDQMQAVINDPAFGVSAQPIAAPVMAAALDAGTAVDASPNAFAAVTLATDTTTATGDASRMAADSGTIADPRVQVDSIALEPDTQSVEEDAAPPLPDFLNLPDAAIEHLPILPDRAAPRIPLELLTPPTPILTSFPSSPPGAQIAGTWAAHAFGSTPQSDMAPESRSAPPNTLVDDTPTGSGVSGIQGDAGHAVYASTSRADDAPPGATDSLTEQWFAPHSLNDDLTLLDEIVRGEGIVNAPSQGSVAAAWEASHRWLSQYANARKDTGEAAADGADLSGLSLLGTGSASYDMPQPVVGLRNVSGHQLTSFHGLREGMSVLAQP